MVGVAHNLKTPIMSISGASEGLEDLITEYKKSIDDPDVTKQDHHDIANEMEELVKKIRSYNSYMSDIITAVKGQAVSMNETNTNECFSIEELLSRVNILMKHELKESQILLNIIMKVGSDTKISGNINSLVQVINNLISNAIQSYCVINEQESTKISNLSEKNSIDIIVDQSKDNILISVSDKGCGMTEEVQNKLFKEMITTKGHNGSGLGLFMSYSTIKGNFKGNLTFTSKVGIGTTFNIEIPKI